ncbi:DNA-binding transcriptional LysR family regulator [Solirubrobacter pauli]|uniref:DNA-binding transcriptional LysR family regulator n=1 Tax=Solirubrobacter pauli TaxID=166793 RepID=A0A660KY97_9ACTN|nr:LysR family transcriptional regulator [Solirubrobacter pauli]RKQ86055.1 DNA-binding transcriptional LysR family regulator [Solirubrobacter pauli]
MELRHLATFVAVAEEGSFTRASVRLHVVQSAVSAGVRTLERELGATLFDRSTHQVALTDAGRALLPEARATLAAASAAQQAVELVRGGLRGTVRVGVIQADALSGFSLARLLATFRVEHPEVEFDVRQGFSAEMADAVREGRLDFAVLALSGRRASGLELTPIRREVMLLGVHTGHRLADRADVDFATLAEETFADGPPKWGTRVAADRAFAAAGLERRVTLEINDTRTVIDFVRHGVAVAFLAPSFVREPDGIALVPIRHHAPIFETFIAEPATRRLGAAASALLELAKRQVEADR